MPRLLHDQIVVVAGADTSLGRETARHFAYRGARLLLAGRERPVLEALAGSIRKDAGQAIVLTVDMAEAVQVEDVVKAALDRFGRLDTWVNTTGLGAYGGFERASLDALRRVLDVDFWGVAYVYKHALPAMRATGGGTIITLVPALVENGLPLQAANAAAAHALAALTASIRQELADDEVPIALVLVKTSPLGPLVNPARLARTIVKLAERPRPAVVVADGIRTLRTLARLAPRHYARRLEGGSQDALRAGRGPIAPWPWEAPEREPGDRRPGWVMWLESHPALAVAGLAVAGAALAAAVRPRR